MRNGIIHHNEASTYFKSTAYTTLFVYFESRNLSYITTYLVNDAAISIQSPR